MFSKTILVILVFICFSKLDVGECLSSVKCYSCRSDHNPSCGDPFNGTISTVSIVGCDETLLERLPKCTKGIIEFADRMKPVIYRGCYKPKFLQSCTRIDNTAGGVYKQCEHCTGDYCNTAPKRNTVASAIILYLTCVINISFFRNYNQY